MTQTYVNWTNVTDLAQLPAEVNNVTGGGFWVGMLYMVWIILILVTIQWGLEVSLLVASFACLILGFVLVYTGLVAWTWLLTFVGVILFMLIYIGWNQKTGG